MTCKGIARYVCVYVVVYTQHHVTLTALEYIYISSVNSVSKIYRKKRVAYLYQCGMTNAIWSNIGLEKCIRVQCTVEHSRKGNIDLMMSYEAIVVITIKSHRKMGLD